MISMAVTLPESVGLCTSGCAAKRTHLSRGRRDDLDHDGGRSRAAAKTAITGHQSCVENLSKSDIRRVVSVRLARSCHVR